MESLDDIIAHSWDAPGGSKIFDTFSSDVFCLLNGILTELSQIIGSVSKWSPTFLVLQILSCSSLMPLAASFFFICKTCS